MNRKEKELFFELCAFCNPNRKKIERLLNDGAATPEVLGNLFANRMAGVAYHVLKETALLDRLDREFRNSLSNASLLNEKINTDFLGCIKYLSTELEECGVSYALLKGAYLCHRYPKGGRTSNDIDVLIAPEDVGKVSVKLKMAGFKQGHLKNGVFVPATRQQIIESKMTRGETVPFIKEIKLPFIKNLEVDLNFSLDYKNSNDETLKEMLSRTRLVPVETAKIRTLDKNDFILHLCAHLYKEAATVPWIGMKRDMTFYKYADLYLMLGALDEGDSKKLISVADHMNLQKEFAYCLTSLDFFFGIENKVLINYLNTIDKTELNIVFAPSEKKEYCYIEQNPKKRFFSKDRMILLREVSE